MAEEQNIRKYNVMTRDSIVAKGVHHFVDE